MYLRGFGSSFHSRSNDTDPDCDPVFYVDSINLRLCFYNLGYEISMSVIQIYQEQVYDLLGKT